MRSPLPLLLTCALALGARADEPPRPNIVFVFADDLGYGEVGVYGEADILTPRIDTLAEGGLRFTQAYATAPLCAPSRCGQLTGFHTGHCSTNRNYGPNIPLRVEDVTVAELLQGAGYHTAIWGKWGLGGQFPGEWGSGPVNLHAVPELKGFDHSLVYRNHAAAHSYYPEVLWLDGEEMAIPENEGGAEVVYSHDLFMADALAWIEEKAVDPDPFYAQLSITLPHREYEIPDVGDYAAEPWPEVEQNYAAMVTLIDTSVGQVVDLLEAFGITEQTLVIVASDNGPAQAGTDGQVHQYDYFGGAGPLRGSKADLYEGGLRVPMVVSWPGTVGEGEVSDQVVAMHDFLPTAAALAGAAWPAGIDGISLAPLLTGEGEQAEHEYLVFTQHGSQNGPDAPPADVALRMGDWKLVVLENGVEQLYDLAVDVGETTDLSADHPDVVAEMLDILATEDTGPPIAALPRLVLGGDVTAEGELPADDPAVTALYLRFDHDGGASGDVAGEVVDASDDVANPGAGVNGATWTADTPGTVPLTGEDNDLALHLEGAYDQALEVPHHPLLSFGDVPFTLEAWVRLDTLASGDGADDRGFLFLKKESTSEDAYIGYAFMAQAGAVVRLEDIQGNTTGPTGRELALFFGHGSHLEEDKWAIVSHLAIEDHDWHHVAVTFDPEAGLTTFHLDEQVDPIPFEDDCHIDPCHSENQGPLLIGGHHDVNGTVGTTLDGSIDEVRVSRGVVPEHLLLDGAGPVAEQPAVTYTADLGEVELGSEPVERCVEVLNGATQYAHLLVGEVQTHGADDPRLSVTGGAFGPIADGGSSGCITLTLDPSAVGSLVDQQVTIEASAYTYGFEAVGSPAVLRVTGDVVEAAADDDDDDSVEPPADDDTGVEEGCGCGPTRRPGATAAALLALLAGLALWRPVAGRRAP